MYRSATTHSEKPNRRNRHGYIASVAVLCWGQGDTGPPNLAQAPKFLIGSIVISLSHRCLPNDEGPAPLIFFLEPPLGSVVT